MGAIDQKQVLFENILRLRDAARDVPHSEELSVVRASLERQLGPTVSRRLAARLLGVSHTALDRWITAGDVPLVYSTSGRREVPLHALLDLRDSVDAQRAQGMSRHLLAPTIARQRKAADRLDLPEFKNGDGRRGHDRARARSLAYHRALAGQLRKPMVDEARYLLFRWRQEGRIDPRYADRWESLLTRPLPELRRALVDESQDGDDLRQNSPLAGLLSEPERHRILREVV
ncbi:MAG: hypothetical protein WAL63_11015 [Solirubrobacteraceae bacterium]